MKFPQLDKRTKEDLLERIKHAAASYVPEWRFDEENKDVGMALVFLFVDMFTDTIQRFNKIPEKNFIEFFSRIGATLQPAIPSRGYAAFQLVNEEAMGSSLPSKTKIQVDYEDGSGKVFETLNAVYVGASSIKCIYQEDGRRDTIFKLYKQSEEQRNPEKIHLFCEKGNNLQKHRFYLGHDEILRTKGETKIILTLKEWRKDSKLRRILPLFAKREKVTFSYSTIEGYEEFERVETEENKIFLYKTKNQPEIAKRIISQVESYYLCCEILGYFPFEDFHIQEIQLASEGKELKPDQILADGEEQEYQNCYPFGETFTPYTECYFCCDDALWKHGAQIELSFQLDYVQVPINLVESEEQDWKLVMKESEVAQKPTYNISIGEISLEYYNGNGFCKLAESKYYEKIFQFNSENLGRKVTIQFQCPKDLAPFLVGARECCCIRARILKVKNQYKLQGHYLTPFLSNINFSYQYKQGGQVPHHLFCESRMEIQYWNETQLLSNQEELMIFPYLEKPEMTVYLGFDVPPENSLLRYLVVLEEESERELPVLEFSFWNGREYQNLPMIDGTESLKKTGIITLLGTNGFKKMKQFQEEYYWIRIQNIGEAYQEVVKSKGREIQGIYENTVEVLAVQSMEEEQLEVAEEEKSLKFSLLYQPVYDSQVWVREEQLTEDEQELLKQQELLREVLDPNGQIKETWVKWDEVEHFMASSSSSRHYQLDHQKGVIQFSDGIHGRIPEKQEGVSNHVQYRIGGGRDEALLGEIKGRLMEPSGFIKEVIFPLPMQNGIDQETIQGALNRKRAELKHQGRAVTSSDFEALAFESDRNILKAKCYSGFNAQGEKEAGNIVLVVLLMDYEKQTNIFLESKERIMQELTKRMSDNIVTRNKFQIVEAVFIQISVFLIVEISESNQMLEWKQKLLQRLSNFLNPVRGNFDGNGWEIGMLPNQTQILNAIRGVREPITIHRMRIVTGQKKGGEFVELPLDKVMKQPFTVCVNGKHEIEISLKKGH